MKYEKPDYCKKIDNYICFIKHGNGIQKSGNQSKTNKYKFEEKLEQGQHDSKLFSA